METEKLIKKLDDIENLELNKFRQVKVVKSGGLFEDKYNLSRSLRIEVYIKDCINPIIIKHVNSIDIMHNIIPEISDTVRISHRNKMHGFRDGVLLFIKIRDIKDFNIMNM